MSRKIFHALALVFFVGLWLVPADAWAQKQDRQLWSTFSLNHALTEDWSLGLWGQGRLNDNMSRGNQLLLLPNLHYRIAPGLKVGAGYMYWAKNGSADEHDIMQEISYSLKLGRVPIGNRIRLEERFINGIGGILWRGRHRLHLAYPIKDSRWSLVAWNEIFVNINEKNEGPPHGYEQNRLFGGVGFRMNGFARLSVGYLWRNNNKRNARSQDDHILSVSFLFDTKGGFENRPTVSESHR